MNHSWILMRDWFGTDEMRKIFSEQSILNGWLSVELALAQSQFEMGLVPEEAYNAIRSNVAPDQIDIEAIAEVCKETRHVIAGFVRHMRRKCGSAGNFFHLAATTQDILETGLTLNIRPAFESVCRDIGRLLHTLLDLAEKYQHAIMAGRTQGQIGMPITFGFKTAAWADELGDHLERIAEMHNRLNVLSLSGALGTQAGFSSLLGNKKTQEMTQRVGEILNLKVPDIDPHHRVDRFAEALNALALTCSTLGRMGLTIRDLQRTEVAEVFEPWGSGTVGSSTMTHKRNPEPSHWLEGLAKITRANALAMMDMQMQHERDATRTAPMLACIPESFLAVSAALKIALQIFKGLDIDSSRMLANLGSENGVSLSEAVWVALFKKSGNLQISQNLVKECVHQTREHNVSFLESLQQNKEVIDLISPKELIETLSPENCIGTCIDQIKSVVNKRRPLAKKILSNTVSQI